MPDYLGDDMRKTKGEEKEEKEENIKGILKFNLFSYAFLFIFYYCVIERLLRFEIFCNFMLVI